MKKKVNVSVNMNMLLANIARRECASSWSLSRSYGLPINVVREQMAINNVRDEDKE